MSSFQIRMVDKYQLKKHSKIVLNKYEVGDKIGQGPFSTVYAVMLKTIDSKKLRAIKVENEKVKDPQISKEVSIIKKIFADQPKVIGFPKLYQYGFESDFNYMVMKLLGPNLAQLSRVCGGVFSMKTTIYVGLQILDRIQKLHNLGYLYVDMKPQNFLTGLGQDSPFIYMIDFGKCQLYKNKKNGNHIPYKQSQNNIFGQVIFCSINSHNGIQYSRRDDIQSFIYMLIYLAKGNLPWNHIQSKSKTDTIKKIFQIKKKTAPQSLVKGLNIQLADLIWYARTLSFYQKPDYQFIRHKLYNCLDEEQLIDNEICYDWTNSEEFNYNGLTSVPKINLVDQMNAFIQKDEQNKNQTDLLSLDPDIKVNVLQNDNARNSSVLKKNQELKVKKKSVKIEQQQIKPKKDQVRKSNDKKIATPSTTLGRQLQFNLPF